MRRQDSTELLPSPDALDAKPVQPAPPNAKWKPGAILAKRYDLVKALGEGAMGMVFAAHDRELDEAVAIKVLHGGFAEPAALARFRREVKLARRVTHKNVARTFELGEDGGMHFITMELVRGETLSRRLEREGKLGAAHAIPILVAICDALEAAHAAGVVHRDIKPDNVLIESGTGRVVVTDFGIASASSVSGGGEGADEPTFGTPAYIAPEQLGSGPLTEKADLYALGVVMFEVLTGERPWGGDTVRTVIVRRLTEEPRDPRTLDAAIPEGLSEIVLKCMARSPADRPESVREVAEALKRALHAPARSIPAPEPSNRTNAAGTVRPSASRSIAVLPFAFSSGRDLDDLAAGLVEDLADTLSSVRGLAVLAQAAVQRRATSSDPAVGTALNVELVITGSIRAIDIADEETGSVGRATPTTEGSGRDRRSDSGLERSATGRSEGSGQPTYRVSVRLIEVGSDMQKWARRYEVPKRHVLHLAEDISREVALALGREGPSSPRAAPEDPKVLLLYLQARHEMRTFSRRAIDFIEQGLALAPDNAVLHSAFATACLRAVFGGHVEPTTIDRARAAAERAIELAPEMGEPYLARAQLLLHMGDGPGGARAAREAIARAPSLADAHELLGRLLIEAGRVTDGLKRLEVALKLDPDLVNAPWERIRLAALEREWTRVDKLIHEAPARRDGAFIYRMRYAMWRRDVPALASLDREYELRQAEWNELLRKLIIAVLSACLVKTPATTAYAVFDEILSKSFAGARLHMATLQLKAECAAFCGDAEVAVEAVAEVARRGLYDVVWLEQCALLDGLRDRPEVRAAYADIQVNADAIIDAVWS